MRFFLFRITQLVIFCIPMRFQHHFELAGWIMKWNCLLVNWYALYEIFILIQNSEMISLTVFTILMKKKSKIDCSTYYSIIMKSEIDWWNLNSARSITVNNSFVESKVGHELIKILQLLPLIVNKFSVKIEFKEFFEKETVSGMLLDYVIW